MLFVRRPYHLSDQEADGWMRSQAGAIAQVEPVTRVEVSTLRSAGGGSSGSGDWMIEIHCDGAEGAGRAARAEALRDLVGDLRLLGMQPRLVLADDTEPLER
jgi:hypothetical protein